MSSDQLFDTIGTSYAATRPGDPRIAARIWAALGDARTVVNAAPGTGSPDAALAGEVTAVEPSAVMRAQRPACAAPCVPGVAGRLPFADQSFDAAIGGARPTSTGRTSSPTPGRCGASPAAS